MRKEIETDFLRPMVIRMLRVKETLRETVMEILMLKEIKMHSERVTDFHLRFQKK